MILPSIKNTPATLVENGKIHTGFFKEPFRSVKLLDANNFGGLLAKPLRWLRLKEWVGFGINHHRLFGGILTQNSKYAASGTVYLYNKETREFYDWLVIDLPTLVKMPESLWNNKTICGHKNRKIIFEHDLENGQHRIKANIKSRFSKQPSVKVDLVLYQDLKAVDPLVVSLPILPDHHTYTHKSPLSLEGTIKISDKIYDFDPQRDFGNLDEQKTFYPYKSHWKWGCFVAQSLDNHQIMLNIVDQMTPKDEPGEDAMWVDGKLILLKQPRMIPGLRKGDFIIEDDEGRMKFTFTADGSKSEDINYKLIKMDYQQFFGRYNGEISDANGKVYKIENAFGALEQMDARF